MIAQLHGTLLDKRPNQVMIDVHGVGYQVQIPFSTYGGLGDLHGEVTLLIHTHLREDGISLYGFLSSREKQCFELLISASGVGPSLAMKILSGMNVEDLVPAVRSGDLAALVKIPGVGKKTAERIVVELRDKLAAMEAHEPARAASPGGPAEDVISALVNLGLRAARRGSYSEGNTSCGRGEEFRRSAQERAAKAFWPRAHRPLRALVC